MWKAVEYTRRWYFFTSSPNAARSPRWARSMRDRSSGAIQRNYRSRMDFRQPGGSLSLHLLLERLEVVLDGGALHLLAKAHFVHPLLLEQELVELGQGR